MKHFLRLIISAILSVYGFAHAQTNPSNGIVTSGMPVRECMDPKNRHTPLCKDMEDDMQEMVVIHHASGVVKAIDPVSGTVTLAHGPVESLRWPAMTKSFLVRDKTLFAKLAVDKKIEFEFEQQGTSYVMTGVLGRTDR